MKCLNNYCAKEFDENENFRIKKNDKIFTCPFCKEKQVYIKKASGLIKLKNGMFERENKKIKMSKKQRLKERRKNGKRI